MGILRILDTIEQLKRLEPDQQDKYFVSMFSQMIQEMEAIRSGEALPSRDSRYQDTIDELVSASSSFVLRAPRDYEDEKSYGKGGQIVSKEIQTLSISDYFLKLSQLHNDHNVQWTLGSGEERGKNFAGIAYSKGSNIWQNLDAWFFSDDILEVLSSMVKVVEGDYEDEKS